jgi:transcriptional regulator with PAS, ATPase and Fis domain
MANGLEAAKAALRAGRYRDAESIIRQLRSTDTEVALCELEANYYLGRRDYVRIRGTKFLESNISPAQAAHCTVIVASQLCDDGEISPGIAQYQRALELGQRLGDARIICIAATRLLERACDDTQFDVSLPLATLARRAAVKAGDPQLTAHVHLSCGRLEGRAGHFETAHRHFALVRELLEHSPNLRLSAIADHDEGCVLGTAGDMNTALQLVDRGTQLSEQSGYSKGIAIGAGNRGHVLAALGRYDEAERHLKIAEELAFENAAFVLTKSLTRADIATRMGRFDVAESILQAQAAQMPTVALWYVLERELVKARLLLRQQRWSEALLCAESGRRNASAAGMDRHTVSLSIVAAEARMRLGTPVQISDLTRSWNRKRWPVSLHGDYLTLMSSLLQGEGRQTRANALLKQAIRVFEGAGEIAAATELRSTDINSGSATPALSASDYTIGLDVAAAVIDLTGFPHVSAHEVVAVLDSSCCVKSRALIAVSSERSRVIHARGWSEAEALAALRASHGIEVITVGEYRGETWQIIARPSETIDAHCTFTAIQKLVSAAAELDRLRRQEQRRAALWPADALEMTEETIWASEQMSEVINIARRIAPTTLPVLLTGETGTGKEVLARTIHRASDRADKTFLPFNCSAVPRDMLESQLFGYRKGAFTGAESSFQGVIRAAAGGTLFLDEIGEIGFDLQPKLLRFLETNEIHPLGEPQPIKVDVRIVAATNANLERLVAEGRFREDLFYRLKVVGLTLPPLRERREEIPPLVQYYLRRFSDEQKKGQLTLSDETFEYLLLYAWPGNVRQLANEVRRLVAMAEADATITPAALSPEIQASRKTIPAEAVMPPTEPEVRLRLNQPLPEAVEMLEQTMIRNALSQSRGRVEEAAKLLGISRKGLFLKRRRWNLDQRQAS